MDEDAPDQLKEALGGPADLVLSDMAANTVGHPQTDHLRTMALVEAGLEFASGVASPGRRLVAKVLAGGADNQLVAELKRHLRDREARQAACQPQGFERMVRRGAGIQGAPSRSPFARACAIACLSAS